MTWDLIAIGNPVYDDIQTPYISTGGRVLSGCSTNACLATAKLGLENVGIIGKIGDDYKVQFTQDISRHHIQPAFIGESPESGGFKLVYQENGDRTLDVLGQADTITIDDIPSECLSAKMIAIGPILGEISLDVLQYIRENSDAGVFIDPQGFIREIQPNGRILRIARNDTAQRIARSATFLKPNEHEAEVFTKSLDHRNTAQQLVSWGAEVGIVTLADRGSIITDGKSTWQIPAYSTIAKDPTGAGDTYMGGFIYSWLKRNGDLVDHALFASATASMMVEHTGPDFPMDVSSVEQRVETLSEQVHRL